MPHPAPTKPKRRLNAGALLPMLAAAILALALPCLHAAGPATPRELPIIPGVEAQPLIAQIQRLVEATDHLGVPFSQEEKAALEAAYAQTDPEQASTAMQQIVDRHCLVLLAINQDLKIDAARGPAKAELMQQGWRQFLIKVYNPTGTEIPLRVISRQGQSPFSGGSYVNESDKVFMNKGNAPKADPAERWLDLHMVIARPMTRTLSGLALEYRIMEIYSRDAGQHEAILSFDVSEQSTPELSVRNDVDIAFQCVPARLVTLNVKDDQGKPTIGAFIVRDGLGRIYPAQAKRLAPDLAFQPQVYRGEGETLTLPDGAYTVQFSRGPESLPETRTLTVNATTKELSFQSKRWIDPSLSGWWSGDHHIHAAGCSHYVSPMEGVLPKDMVRYVIGEDLKIGANLTWGPCFDFQKQFFCGVEDNSVSKYPYLLHYDIEVSGFGSHQSGHLALLRLKTQIYPGGDSKDHWPTLCLNTLRWAKQQGAIAGFAHSGAGLQVHGTTLPTYEVPPYDGVGANEYIVDVTHEVPGPDDKPVPAVDFISMVNTPPIWELNMWYHTLNAGFRTRISGETDFPCILDDRVGMGRSYVKLEGKLTYEDWCEGIRLGRSYVGDGRSHLMNFALNGVNVGEHNSEVRLDKPGVVHASVAVAAKLADDANPNLNALMDPLNVQGEMLSTSKVPYWSIERARIGTSKEVPLEIIVNGQVVATSKIIADGSVQKLNLDVPIETSSWVAVRILPSSHTNPIFVVVGEKPIRSSRKSVEWCLQGVDQCWSQKAQFIRPAEMNDAKQAYAHAREVYAQRLTECTSD